MDPGPDHDTSPGSRPDHAPFTTPDAVAVPTELLEAMIELAGAALAAPDGEDGDDIELEALRDLRDLVLQAGALRPPTAGT